MQGFCVSLPLADPIVQSNIGVLTCSICPYVCNLSDGSLGKCSVIKNKNGQLINIYYGQCSHISVQKIEKRPLFHFCCGQNFLSVGLWGCNFSCGFCQNHKVSQDFNGTSVFKTPQDLVNLAIQKKTSGIVFSFNEPTIHIDYVLEVSHIAKKHGLKVVLKTNGFITPMTAEILSEHVDALNIDIKGDESDYKNTCKGDLEPVLKSIEYFIKQNVHVEISYLVLPSIVKNMYYNINFVEWLRSVGGTDVPVHILYFYPFHKMTHSSYEKEDLIPIVDLFKQKLNYVYVSNSFSDLLKKYRQTYCLKCGSLLVDRTSSTKILSNMCCGQKIKGL